MCILRKARKRDGSQILKLVETVLSVYGLKVNPAETDLDLSNIWEFYFEKGGWFAVLEDQDKIIGSYGLFKVDEVVCELRKMYLLQDYHGRGLGKMLLNNAEKKAKELGFKEIVLETNSKLDNAYGLYKKYGFKEYFPSNLSDRCDLAMRKNLD